MFESFCQRCEIQESQRGKLSHSAWHRKVCWHYRRRQVKDCRSHLAHSGEDGCLQSLQWNISDQMTEYWLKRNIGTTAARGLSCRLCTEAVRAECDSRDTFAHCDFLREANIHVVSSQRPLSV